MQEIIQDGLCVTKHYVKTSGENHRLLKWVSDNITCISVDVSYICTHSQNIYSAHTHPHGQFLRLFWCPYLSTLGRYMPFIKMHSYTTTAYERLMFMEKLYTQL